jgi:uncharacterized protein (DUF983 family)
MTNYVPCPKCGGAAEKLKFTWWGGVIGPRILTHVKCTQCGHRYNGKSGTDNMTGIVIYSVVVGVLVMGLVFMMFVAMALLTIATR